MLHYHEQLNMNTSTLSQINDSKFIKLKLSLYKLNGRTVHKI
jgi:hypothetical protein